MTERTKARWVTAVMVAAFTAALLISASPAEATGCGYGRHYCPTTSTTAPPTTSTSTSTTVAPTTSTTVPATTSTTAAPTTSTTVAQTTTSTTVQATTTSTTAAPTTTSTTTASTIPPSDHPGPSRQPEPPSDPGLADTGIAVGALAGIGLVTLLFGKLFDVTGKRLRRNHE